MTASAQNLVLQSRALIITRQHAPLSGDGVLLSSGSFSSTSIDVKYMKIATLV